MLPIYQWARRSYSMITLWRTWGERLKLRFMYDRSRLMRLPERSFQCTHARLGDTRTEIGVCLIDASVCLCLIMPDDRPEEVRSDGLNFLTPKPMFRK